MNKFFKKYAVTIGFIISFVFDAKYNMVEHFISDIFWVNVVKGLGALALAYFTGSKLQSSFSKEEGIDSIGGSQIPPDKDEK